MPDGSGVGRLAELVLRHLGDDVLGAYLHGSATLGGLRPHSDIDLLVVTRRSLGEVRRRALTDALMRVSGGGRRPVELSCVVRDAVRPWRYPPECDFLYGEWRREEYERGAVPLPGPCPDLALLLTVVLGAGAPVYGPPPARLLDPVPHTDVLRAMRDGIPDLLAGLETDTRNVLLTLCRIWLTFSTGEIRSKEAAAGWALERIPHARHRAVVAHARAVCTGEEKQERWEELRDGIAPAARFLVRAIGAAGAGRAAVAR
ncbi:DUF4111 domain-containing protein [Streptomyces sp. SBST2-5]|uniref:DUF4111 domain-containing protein n=1 Tax=Streptomyces composti TaxID=2720025 RepID=A0ABX1A9P4_9ACTN|nr:aminoglycoside adenylyltransferase domain-containing protein [Streptomyces composti]NJP51354.1 DUF4111 domain-containing protein [Streptomyces composti]